ncbi:SDR family oxidoreductase [Variovorax sp. PCZ-1]|uniref:SDR family oxidoreductase n=1 Tax=Variovorax sp. PCZ-1 TaxID=2835533 RepID=UPI001BCD2D9D|nr:SDR family oxidoreductase [Variovorax sp. PCZ-1]MBS7806552.1 SDR family oxidoreductase [Variovorax sp. PCZ-1]
MNVLIIGASRGIGLEFVRQYRQAGARVIATARSDEGLARISALGAKALRVDVAQPASVSGLAWQLDGEKIDVAVYVAGVWADGSAKQPPTQQLFDATMYANVLGAMQALPQVAPLVEEAGGKFAFISSGMGSITEVESSYGWTYRVSKAALNMAVQSARFDYPKAYLMALCPGWVRTDMGGANASISVEESVSAMRKTISNAKKSDAHVFWHHDGSKYTGW